jgi:peptide/nickel transport system permease protein
MSTGNAPAVNRKRSARVKMLFGLGLVLLIVLPVLLVPIFGHHDPLKADLAARLLPPGSADHILGTDQVGRDLLARLALGGRVSLLTGFLAIIGAGVIGGGLGLLAGFLGGWFDSIVTRLLEMQLALPLLMLLLIIIAVFGQNLPVIILVLAIAQWPELAKLARSVTLVEREKTYVEAARALGAPTSRIILRHIIPNVIDPILTMLALLFAQAILVESALSFVGLSVTRPFPTWGRILSDGREYIDTGWWLVAIPGGMISALVLGVNLTVEGLRELTSRFAG